MGVHDGHDGTTDTGAFAPDERTPEQRTRESSAYAFALEVVTRLAAEGIDAEAEVTPVRVNEPGDGSYHVSVEVEGGGPDVLCEVVDGVPDVRVMDPNGEGMPPNEALAYVVRRALGDCPRDAAAAVWPATARWGVPWPRAPERRE
ncbi:hypothetical protein ACWFNE_08915 [Cellulomonas sp. NPDC055163]